MTKLSKAQERLLKALPVSVSWRNARTGRSLVRLGLAVEKEGPRPLGNARLYGGGVASLSVHGPWFDRAETA